MDFFEVLKERTIPLEWLVKRVAFLTWYNERFKDEMYYMHPKYTQLADRYFRDLEEAIMEWDVTNRDIKDLL